MRALRSLVVLATVWAIAAATSIIAGSSANALTSPVNFTSDDLPTWQTNGIVWTMAQADGVVFAGGTFSQIRPPEGTPGAARNAVNFASFDAASGEPTACQLSFTVTSGSATVRALAVSPDRKTLYAGGYFGAVNGVLASSLIAVDIATCTPRPSFRPSVPATVRALAVTEDTVYAGGDFTEITGQPRRHFAAVAAATGALLPFTADADASGRAVEVTPDRRRVIIGGDFYRLNGADSHTLAVVDAHTGALVKSYPRGYFGPKWTTLRDIAIDGSMFYTAHFGHFDGRIAFRLNDFGEQWSDDCLGGTMAVLPYKGAVYVASHAHDCTTEGEFPDGRRYHLLAESPAGPKKLGWAPDTNDGIGEGIGPRVMSVANAGGTDFLWVGGEFTKVNGAAAQSLTRFASGNGRDTGLPTTPVANASSLQPGSVEVRWRASLDLDDSNLTYRVYRDGSSTPVSVVTGASLPWSRPQMTFTDTSVTAGRTYSYRVTATDATGNTSSLSAAVTARPTVIPDPYPTAIRADRASLYWRYDDTQPYAADSSATGANGTYIPGAATQQPAPAVPGGGQSIALNGTGYLRSERRINAPAAYSLETWFKTTSISGGKLIGFGNQAQPVVARVNARPTFDRQVSMTADGRLLFAIFDSTGSRLQTLTSQSTYNDGVWHQVVAAQGPVGMALYVDGHLVSRRSITSRLAYTGYWHVGGDNRQPARPDTFFTGSLDETAVYPSVLNAQQVAEHYRLSGRIPTVNWAAGTPARQSSTDYGGVATRGVDGSTNGDYRADSVTHTARQQFPWWQTDLGARQNLRAIAVYNRTDCCSERLKDYWVFISDAPFTPGLTPAQQSGRTGVWARHQTALAGTPVTIPANRAGRYVMIQLGGVGYLSIAEVKALGDPPAR